MMKNPIEMGCSENQIQNSNWLFDYDLMMDDISAVSGHNFSGPSPAASIDFGWTSQAIKSTSTAWLDFLF